MLGRARREMTVVCLRFGKWVGVLGRRASTLPYGRTTPVARRNRVIRLSCIEHECSRRLDTLFGLWAII